MKKLIILAAASAAFVSSEAMASGFNLREQSVSALGNAFAGATAGAEDISYSYFNPAGLTRHKGTQINAGGTYIGPRSKAKRAQSNIPGIGNQETGYTGDIVHSAVAPFGYASHQFSDRFTGAVSMNVPYGMITKYEDDWAGRMHGTLSKVETMTVTPMGAYKVTDQLSLGAGLQMQYIKARLRNGTLVKNPSTGLPVPDVEDRATLTGDTFDVGYQLGALYELNEQTRFGVGYRSSVAHKLHGKIRFDGMMTPANQDIDARIKTPATLTVGAYHDIDEKWSVMGEVGRTYWSSFQDLIIEGDKSGMLSTTEEKWKDTTFWAIGASYKVNEQWKLRAGFAMDQSAVGEHYRTPRIPDSDRKWYSAGVQYKYSENMTFDVGYTYIRAEKGGVNLGHSKYDAGRGTLKADYENDVHILGIGLNYAF